MSHTGGLFSHDHGHDGNTIVCGFEGGMVSVFDNRNVIRPKWCMTLDSSLSEVGDLRRHPVKDWFGFFGRPGFSLN